MLGCRWFGVTLLAFVCLASPFVRAQTVTERGVVEAHGVYFPQAAPNDSVQVMGDLLAREEVFVRPAQWLRLAGGIEWRSNSHDQVDHGWRVDVSDRGARRPPLSLRRATATIVRGPLTLDIGKQFIRWGKTDILNPTDRFAPRDFLNVIDSEFLGVSGIRAVVRARDQDSIEFVWLPRFTPSRIPLLTQRWTAVSPETPQVQIVDRGAVLPAGHQVGLRWSRVARRLEYSVSFFDGYNHLPSIDVQAALSQTVGGPSAVPLRPEVDLLRIYPRLRSYGADAAMPTRWFTLKAEMAYFGTPSPAADEYVLIVIEVERQTGEWVLLGGYAGEIVTNRRAPLVFAPDRGLTKSVVGRASYTIDVNRSLAFETAIRQNLDGAYVKAEYSHAYDQHWRGTMAAVLLRGQPDDFLGQYRKNSQFSLSLRYSF